MTGAGTAIEVADLRKDFGRTHALRGVSFAVPAGTVFGVIGPNGAGKTTLMRTLLDVIRPTSGTATVLGHDSRSAGPELRRRIGYLPGELILEGRVTGLRLLTNYAYLSGPVRLGRIEQLADRLEVDLGRQVRTLSKGNKQKLGIIQAFLHQPDVLVLDEPTSGLDPLMQQKFLAMVAEARGAGQTVFLSSHVISEVQQIADQVAILRDGQVIDIATVDRLRDSAIRHLRMTVAGIGAADLRTRMEHLAGVGSLRVDDSHPEAVTVTATLTGPIPPFLHLIAGLAVNDLVLDEPDLEESVLRLYATDSAPLPDGRASG